MKDKTHKHHIVPRYVCKKLGIDPDFQGNHVTVTIEQHAKIHNGYYRGDLAPLLEVCSPPKNILDLIELGNNYDQGAAHFIMEGADYEVKGKANPNYKDGMYVGRMEDPDLYKKIDRIRHQKEWSNKRITAIPRMNFWYHKNETRNIVEARKYWNEWYSQRKKSGFKSKNRQSLWETDTFEMWWYREGNELDFREKYAKKVDKILR